MPITDPSEEYFKDGLWGWVSSAWSKIHAFANLLGSAPHGYRGGSWYKQPLVFGYSGRYVEQVTILNSGGGFEVLYGTAVPTGEIWVIESISGRDKDSAPSAIYFRVDTPSGHYPLKMDYSPGNDKWTIWNGRNTIVAGERVFVAIGGVTSGDDLEAFVSGYKMKIAE